MGQVVAGLLGGLAARRVIAGLITGLGTLFKSRLGLFIVTAMAWLGINFATIKIAVEPALDLLYGYVSNGSGAGQYAGVAMQWVGVMQLDKAATMIGSAIMAKKIAVAGRLFLFRKGFGARP